jgi:hypothetical protein
LNESSKISMRIKPIVLGGQYVVRLDGANEPRINLPEPSPIILNLAQVLESAGFDSDEIEYLLATRVNGIQRCDVHQHLGWPRAKVDRVHRTFTAKLAAGIRPPEAEIRFATGSSTAIAVQERIDSGQRIWSMGNAPASEVFLEEIARARSRSIVISSLPARGNSRQCIRGKLRIMRLQLHEVEASLKVERLKLSDLLGKSYVVDGEIAAAETELDGLNKNLREDEETVLLDEGHRPDKTLPKRIEAAEKRLAEIQRRAGAFSGAILKQKTTVDRLQGEIDTRRMEAFRLEVNQPAAEIRKLISDLAGHATAIQETAAKHQIDGYTLALEIFAPTLRNREDFIHVMNRALELSFAESKYTTKAHAA